MDFFDELWGLKLKDYSKKTNITTDSVCVV
jgi:hypothetical protein